MKDQHWTDKYLNTSTDRCWFCHKPGCDEFDMEFDTFLHRECLQRAYDNKDSLQHQEAVIMAYILEG